MQPLSIDIETHPADDVRIFKIGAVRSDADRGLTLSVGRAAARGSCAPSCDSGWTCPKTTPRSSRSGCERRRAVAAVVLRTLMASIPDGTREAHRVVECKARELLDAIASDLDLAQTLKDPASALEHALLYLHQNKVVELDKGRAVFRPAMTLRLNASSRRRRFTRETYIFVDEYQNIYSFEGASVAFIRRFHADYGGAMTYLVENFRSSQHIVSAANHVIQGGTDRMKVDHPIRINQARSAEPAGARWAQRDAEGLGRVRRVSVPSDSNRQAQVVGAAIERLLPLDSQLKPGPIAVLARTHRTLEPLRARLDLAAAVRELASSTQACRAPCSGWTAG